MVQTIQSWMISQHKEALKDITWVSLLQRNIGVALEHLPRESLESIVCKILVKNKLPSGSQQNVEILLREVLEESKAV